MKKILSIVAAVVALSSASFAQNQLIATVWTNGAYTIGAADTNAVSLVITNQDMSKVYGIILRNTGAVEVKYAFGALQATTNITLIRGVRLAAAGSVTYQMPNPIPSFPLVAKTTSNGTQSTLEVELLKRQ